MAGRQKRVGVLALQGDFTAHIAVCNRIGLEAQEVRTAQQLRAVDGLIIPGGESGALLRLMQPENLLDRIAEFEGPILGTCAGAIILAKKVSHPEQGSAGRIDISVERNGYGRQLDSFEEQITLSNGRSMTAIFIRAPKITQVGSAVEVIAELDGSVVLAKQGLVTVATFHPELTNSDIVHALAFSTLLS